MVSVTTNFGYVLFTEATEVYYQMRIHQKRYDALAQMSYRGGNTFRKKPVKKLEPSRQGTVIQVPWGDSASKSAGKPMFSISEESENHEDSLDDNAKHTYGKPRKQSNDADGPSEMPTLKSMSPRRSRYPDRSSARGSEPASPLSPTNRGGAFKRHATITLTSKTVPDKIQSHRKKNNESEKLVSLLSMIGVSDNEKEVN